RARSSSTSKKMLDSAPAAVRCFTKRAYLSAVPAVKKRSNRTLCRPKAHLRTLGALRPRSPASGRHSRSLLFSAGQHFGAIASDFQHLHWSVAVIVSKPNINAEHAVVTSRSESAFLHRVAHH